MEIAGTRSRRRGPGGCWAAVVAPVGGARTRLRLLGASRRLSESGPTPGAHLAGRMCAVGKQAQDTAGAGYSRPSVSLDSGTFGLYWCFASAGVCRQCSCAHACQAKGSVKGTEMRLLCLSCACECMQGDHHKRAGNARVLARAARPAKRTAAAGPGPGQLQATEQNSTARTSAPRAYGEGGPCSVGSACPHQGLGPSLPEVCTF